MLNVVVVLFVSDLTLKVNPSQYNSCQATVSRQKILHNDFEATRMTTPIVESFLYLSEFAFLNFFVFLDAVWLYLYKPINYIYQILVY